MTTKEDLDPHFGTADQAVVEGDDIPCAGAARERIGASLVETVTQVIGNTARRLLPADLCNENLLSDRMARS
jgi:hypothetical protein